MLEHVVFRNYRIVGPIDFDLIGSLPHRRKLILTTFSMSTSPKDILFVDECPCEVLILVSSALIE